MGDIIDTAIIVYLLTDELFKSLFYKNVLKHSIKGQHMQFSLSSVTHNKHSAQWTIILFIGSDILPYLNWFSPFLSCFF